MQACEQADDPIHIPAHGFGLLNSATFGDSIVPKNSVPTKGKEEGVQKSTFNIFGG